MSLHLCDSLIKKPAWNSEMSVVAYELFKLISASFQRTGILSIANKEIPIRPCHSVNAIGI